MSGLFYNDTVRVFHPATRESRSGEQRRDYVALRASLGDAGAGVVRGSVHVRPTSQSETPAEDRTAAQAEWRIATEPGTGDWDVNQHDWIVLPDGTVTQAQGRAARPVDPLTGQLHHVEIQVREVRG